MLGKSAQLSPIGVTDEEFLKTCENAVRAYCRERKKLGNVDERQCVNKALEAFKVRYRSARGLKRLDGLKPEYLREMDEIYMRLKSGIEEMAKKIAFRTTADKKTLEIKQTTVSAAIREALAEAGFQNVNIFCQCYRAKAVVRLPNKYYVTFIMKYKDFMAGKLDHYVAEFLSLIEKIESLPFEVKICK